MPSFDAILIGGGPNGLAAAHALKGQGRRVLVLDQGAVPGGGAAPVGFAPGFAAPAMAHLSHNLDPRVARGMELQRHGLAWANANLATTALSQNGDHLRMNGPVANELVGALAPADRAAWATLRKRLLRFARVLAPFRDMAPPRLAKGTGNPVAKLAAIGLKARMMGADEFRELLRVFLTNTHDVLNDELATPLLRGALAFDAGLGVFAGPRSPNSLLMWLDRLSGQTEGVQGALGLPKGGMPAIARAMAASAMARGVEVRSGVTVGRVLVEGDRAVGVTLTSGEEMRAPLILSAIAPKTTLLGLVGPRHLDAGLVTRLRHLKSRGTAAKLHLALRAAPDFRGADLRTRLILAPTAEEVERAFNPAKYGEVPDAPVMEILLPSAIEPGHAPEGQHMLSAIVQHAPHAPKDPQAARSALLQACLNRLEVFAPGIGALVAHAELLMPYDVEVRTGAPGGNWHLGELSVEQMLFLRPLPGMAQYRTPVSGLWLGSAGCHPGGGISGAAGWNAAAAIERAEKERAGA